MDRNNQFQAYDRPPMQMNQAQYNQPNNFRRDDYGNNGGIRRGGGAMRDHRGRRGGNNNNNNNDRFNDNRPYKRGNRPMGINKARNEYQEDEPRAAREKPCRTLFVRNVQYTIPESEIRNLFAEYGEIKDVFNLIENRGMIFVTFYDVRAAEEAKHAMQGTYLSDRKIDVHYSLPKEEEEKARCDRTKNQGTLLYTLKNTNNELDDHELQSYFSQFGEVKAIRVPNFKKTNTHVVSHLDRNQQRLVEFYDSRACVAAYDATIDAEYKGGKWDVAFFWDHPYKERTNSHQKRERNLDREEMRNKRRDQIKREPYDHYGNQGQRMDDRYHPAPMGAPPMHSHQLDPRLQYNPQPTMPAAMPTAPMASTLGPDNQRLEQAQKAQQILSMLAQQQQQPPTAPAMQATQPIPSLTSPFQPTNLQSPAAKQSPLPGSAPPTAPAASMHQPQQFISPVPPTNDQTSQVQQLLGLLSQAAQQQQQQQQQHQPQLQLPQQQPPQPQMTPQAQPAPQQASPSVIPQGVAPIPGMDAATALSQLAAMLQRQQQNQ